VSQKLDYQLFDTPVLIMVSKKAIVEVPFAEFVVLATFLLEKL